MAQDSDFGAFIAGFFIGGLVGAAVALLLAPQSGEETQKIIREKSIELKDKATESADLARQRGMEMASEARARADELARQARERGEELRTRGQEIFEEQKQRVETTIEKARKAAQPPTEEELGEEMGEA